VGIPSEWYYVVPLCCSHASTPGILDIGSVIPVPKDI